MTREHKIGIAITCTFLCLTGAVIGLKMQDAPTPKNPSETETTSLAPVVPAPQVNASILSPGAAVGRASPNDKNLSGPSPRQTGPGSPAHPSLSSPPPPLLPTSSQFELFTPSQDSPASKPPGESDTRHSAPPSGAGVTVQTTSPVEKSAPPVEKDKKNLDSQGLLNAGITPPSKNDSTTSGDPKGASSANGSTGKPSSPSPLVMTSGVEASSASSPSIGSAGGTGKPVSPQGNPSDLLAPASKPLTPQTPTSSAAPAPLPLGEVVAASCPWVHRPHRPRRLHHLPP